MTAKFSYYVFHITLMNLTLALITELYQTNTDKSNRVYREVGYVYKKPSVSFELPSQSTTVTQGPTVDRIRAQQMYYAYPVPSANAATGASDTVNIGYSTTASTTQAAITAGTMGYSYGSSGNGDSLSTSILNDNTARSVYESQTSYQGSTTSANNYNGGATGGPSIGYNYQSAAPIINQGISSSEQTPSSPFSDPIVTNAPKYLPPTGRSSSVSVSSGATMNSPDLSQSILPGAVSTVTIPSDSYIPPVTSKPSIEPTASSIPTLNTGYLPPKPNPSPTLQKAVSPIPTLSTGYLPPIEINRVNTGGSTPAATYLPPILR